MGCCGSQILYNKLSLELKSKSQEILLYIKAVAMRLIEQDKYAMAIRVIHIRNIIKCYYSTLEMQRTEVIRDIDRLSDEDTDRLDKKIASEKQILEKTAISIKSNFYSIYDDFWLIRPSADKFVSNFKNKTSKLEDYKELKAKCYRYEKNGKGIDYISNMLNNNKKLSKREKRFMNSMCEYTTYHANDKSKRISYHSFDTEGKIKAKISFLDFYDRKTLEKAKTIEEKDNSMITREVSADIPKSRSKTQVSLIVSARR